MQLHASGSPLSVIYNNTYYYVLNLQGDVIGILNSSGAQVVAYTYDAWGRPLSTTGSLASTLGLYNPLRYRGYVYDRETGVYYLRSRYYNPEIGRWISPEPNVYSGGFDEGAGLICYNVYAYCANNPVNFIDIDGEFIATLTAFAITITVEEVITIIVGLVAVGATIEFLDDIVSEAQITFLKSQTKNNPDPYARPNQKKQGRENKNKNRQKNNYTPRNNRRDGKPAPPKHHTPGRDHRKFTQYQHLELYWISLR